MGKQKHDIGHQKRKKNILAAAKRTSKAWTKDFYRRNREDNEPKIDGNR